MTAIDKLSDNGVDFADPNILVYEGKYYAYGTHSPNGIAVAVSDDMRHWRMRVGKAKDGLALHKDDSYGEKWFWAPEIYRENGRFFMFYSADERCCVAIADSPLGPFRQVEKKPILSAERFNIDSSFFRDKDGRPWMIFTPGGGISAVQLTDDLLQAIPETEMALVLPDRAKWELSNPQCSVREGPFMLVIDDRYVLTYSANDYRDKNYAVGYAVADRLDAEWTFGDGSPILWRRDGLVGCGHHSFFRDLAGKWQMVFHAHKSNEEIHPRQMYISPLVISAMPEEITLGLGAGTIRCLEV